MLDATYQYYYLVQRCLLNTNTVKHIFCAKRPRTICDFLSLRLVGTLIQGHYLARQLQKKLFGTDVNWYILCKFQKVYIRV